MNSLTGHFLIASPHLADTNFYRSVILMVQHDEQGAFGVLLNRPTENNVANIVKLIDDTRSENTDPVFMGGPVGGPLTALHTDATRGEVQVVRNVFFTSEKDDILHIVARPEKPFRLFVGYSGWGAGQLEAEMKAGGWLTLPATHRIVFSNSDDLWNRVSRRIGLDILSSTIKPNNIPDDPSMN